MVADNSLWVNQDQKKAHHRRRRIFNAIISPIWYTLGEIIYVQENPIPRVKGSQMEEA
jgi:hypothetical protein